MKEKIYNTFFKKLIFISLLIVISCNKGDSFTTNLISNNSRWILRDTIDVDFIKSTDIYGFNKFKKNGTVESFFYKNNVEIESFNFEKKDLNEEWNYNFNDSIFEFYSFRFKVLFVKKDHIILKNLKSNKIQYLIDMKL